MSEKGKMYRVTAEHKPPKEGKSFRAALAEALREEMLRDKNVFLLGEDIGINGGAFGVTLGFYNEFGAERVRDTPISETAIIGAAIGASLVGMRPVAEIMLSDFIFLAMDQLVNVAAKMRYLYGEKGALPMTVRTVCGSGMQAGPTHGQNLYSVFAHVPGLKVAVPSTPKDAKGLLKTAIRGDDPVLFFENMKLYRIRGEVPEGEYAIPFGKADIKRDGEDVTIVATMAMLYEALAAAEGLEKEGISAEVIDPRTLVPLDKEAIIDSVKKTGKLVVVDEAHLRCGIQSEIAAVISEEAFDYLDAPIKRVGTLNTPLPFSPALEKQVLPNKEMIIQTAKKLVGS